MPIPDLADPVVLFRRWYDEAAACGGIEDHSAMALATRDASGAPDVRFVLLKHFDGAGFVFYTNLGSVKAQQIAAEPCAALCFYWEPLERQIRIRGRLQPVPQEEAGAYFATRNRASQIGAWASKQSQPLAGRFELEKRIAWHAARFGTGAVPRPPFWSGYRLVPDQIEFWMKQPFRLHERVEYRREEEGAWLRRHLYP
jgi:pyridoxamine 5'-phosphate oxidase